MINFIYAFPITTDKHAFGFVQISGRFFFFRVCVCVCVCVFLLTIKMLSGNKNVW